MHIAIAGNIGSGKTTLTNMLAKHYGWTPQFEAVDYNPYLDDYYDDIPRWSFNLEVYFLKQRFRDLLSIAQSDKTISPRAEHPETGARLRTVHTAGIPLQPEQPL